MKIFLKFALGLILIIGGLGLLSAYMLKPPNVPVPPSELHSLISIILENLFSSIKRLSSIRG